MNYDNNTNKASMVILSFFAGMAIGETLGILLASRSGGEIRNGLKKRGKTIGGDRGKMFLMSLEKKDWGQEAKGRIKK